MRVLGVDPGYERLGVAIVEKNKVEELLYSDCIETDKADPLEKRLLRLGTEIKKVIKDQEPDVLAIERAFFNTNQKTALSVAEARGVVVYEATKAGLPIFDYTPGEVKVAVTGYGKGTKEQVISMVSKLVKIEKIIKHDDEYDAIAVGLTHLATLHA